MKKSILLAVISLFLVGCVAQNRPYNAPASWVGRNINDLVSTKGYPDENLTAPNGNEVYVYHHSKTGVKTETVYVPWHARKVKTKRWETHSYEATNTTSHYYETNSNGIIVNYFKKKH